MSVYGTPAVKIVLNTTDPSGSFILNQYAGPQTGNFWVTGKGRVDTRLGIGGVDPTFALHVVTADPIAGSFSGRVIGADAVNPNEFITKAQMDTAIATGATLAATRVGYGSPTNTLTGSSNMIFESGLGKLTLNTGTGRLIQLGNAAPVAGPNPVQIHMGGSYSDTAGVNLKLVLYDNNIGNLTGFGVTTSGLDHVSGGGSHKFFIGSTQVFGMSATQISVLNSLQIVWEDVLAPKLSFYGGIAAGAAGYNMGVASGGILYTNVPTGGKHALRINGVDAFTVSGAGATITTVAQDDTKTSILTWDSTDKLVRWRSASTLITAPDTHTLLSAIHTDTVAGAPVVGAMIVGNGTPAWDRLLGHTVAAKRFLTQTGTGAASAIPVWGVISAADLPDISGTYVPVTRTLTINGSAQDLSANRTWTIAITGVVNRVTVTNGSTLTPIIDIAATYVGQASITTVGTITTGVWNGTTIATGFGGTGLTSYVLGDILYASAANVLAALPGNITTTRRFLRQTGTGAVSAAPVWDVLTVADIGGIDTTYVPLTRTLTINGSAQDLSTNRIWTITTTGTANRITVTGGAGLTPTIDIAATYAGQASIITVGTITTGTWNGSVIGPTFGGTGISTYTLGDILYASATNVLSKLPGNITTGKLFLSQTGTGTVSAAPVWSTMAGSDITGAALTKTDDTNVTLTLGGSPATALLRATSITVGWTGVLGVTRGGTGLAAIAQGDIIYGSAANVFSALTKSGAANMYLKNSGTSNNPAWSAISAADITLGTALTKVDDTNITLTLGGSPTVALLAATSITVGWAGSLAPGRGGTGITTYVLGDTLYASAANVLSKLPGNITAVKQFLSQTGTGAVSAAPVWATIVPANLSMNTARILGRLTAGIGSVEELTGTQVTSMLDLFSTTTTTKGVVPGSNGVGTTFFLRADGTWGVPPGGGGGGYTVLTQFVDETPWRIFYSNAAGDVTPLAFGTSGQVLQSTGASSAPIWATAGGSGTIGGTIAATQVGYGSGANTLTSSANFTFIVGTGLLTLNTAGGKLLQLGDFTAVASADPVKLNMGSSHSATPGINPKLIVQDSGLGPFYGLGVSSFTFDYMAPATAKHNFYVDGVWKFWVDANQIATNANQSLYFVDSIGEKIKFYGSVGGSANYNMGMDSSILFYNVPSVARHQFRLGGVEAYSVGAAGTTTMTTINAIGNIGHLINMMVGQTANNIEVRYSGYPAFQVDNTGSVIASSAGTSQVRVGVDKSSNQYGGMWIGDNAPSATTANFTLLRGGDYTTLNATGALGRIIFAKDNDVSSMMVFTEERKLGIGYSYNTLTATMNRRLNIWDGDGFTTAPFALAKFSRYVYPGTAAAGASGVIEFGLTTQANATNEEIGSHIGTVLADGTAGAEKFDFVISNMTAGAYPTEKFRSLSTGEIAVQTLAQNDALTKVAVWDDTSKLIKWRSAATFGSGTIAGSLAATQVAYGSAANTITGSADFTFITGTLYLNKATGGNIALGNNTATATATPVNINMGGTYSTIAGSNPKIYLHFDGINYFGFGVSASQLDYIAPNACSHNFYIAGSKRLYINNQTTNIADGSYLFFDGATLGNKIYFHYGGGDPGNTSAWISMPTAGNLQYHAAGSQSFVAGYTSTITQVDGAAGVIFNIYSSYAAYVTTRINVPAGQAVDAFQIMDSAVNSIFTVGAGGNTYIKGTLDVWGGAYFHSQVRSDNGDQQNMRMGYNSGLGITTATYTTLYGFQAGASLTTQSENTFMGAYTGWQNTGTSNTAFGIAALQTGTGTNNTALGNRAMGVVSGALSGNIAIGVQAMQNAVGTAQENICIGSFTGTLVAGSGNIYIGFANGAQTATGSHNTCVGYEAGRLGTTLSQNTMIGAQAGYTTGGFGNVMLGFQAGYQETGSNKLYIHNSATTTPLVFGNFGAAGNLYLRTYGQFQVNSDSSTEFQIATTSAFYLAWGGIQINAGLPKLTMAGGYGSWSTMIYATGAYQIYSHANNKQSISIAQDTLNVNIGAIGTGMEQGYFDNRRLNVFEYTGASNESRPIVKLKFIQGTAGVVLPGHGTGIETNLNVYTTTDLNVSYVSTDWAIVGDTADYIIRLMQGGTAYTEKMRIKGTGEMALQLLNQDNALNNVVVWDPTSKLFKFRAASSIGGGTGGGYTTLAQFVDETAWQMFYSNANGDVTNLAFGTAGQVLQSNGAAAAPTWITPGSGAVTITPQQVAYGSATSTVTSSADFTFNLGTLFLNKAAGVNIVLGTTTSTASADPVNINMGGTFSSVAGVKPKLILHDASGSVYGFGVSASQLDYVSPTTTSHKFYIGGVLQVSINTADFHLNTNVQLTLETVANDNALVNIMVWDGTSKAVKWRAASTIISAPTKFGVAGQDNTAAEERAYTMTNNSFEFKLGPGGGSGGLLMGKSSGNNYGEISATIYSTDSTITAQVAINRESTTGLMQVNIGIASTATQNAQLKFIPGEVLLELGSASVFKIAGLDEGVGNKTLRYDTATGLVTYHDIPSGGAGGSGTVTSFAFTNANGFTGSVATSTITPTLTISTSLTLGSVPFIGAGGALLQDNALFFWDNTNKRLGVGTNAPGYRLQVNGSAYVLNNFAHNTQGGWGAFLNNTSQIPAGSTFTAGYTWAGGASSNTMQFAGSSTINQGAIIAGHTVSNRTEFTAPGATITLTQAAGIRVLAGLQILSQIVGTIGGTVTHGASLIIQGVYPTSTGVVNFNNYYGVLINPLDEWLIVTFTNRWAIYQQGPNDPSYFASRIQIGNVTSQGAHMLQVTGGFYVNATTATMRFVGLTTDNTATQVLAKDAAGDNVWRDVSSITGGGGGGTIGGSIAATQVAYGSGANTIAGSANFTWDGTRVTVAASQSWPSYATGTLYLQSYSLTNSWISENAFHNAVGGGWFNTATGGGAVMQFGSGEIAFHLFPSQPAGTMLTSYMIVSQLKLESSGAFGIGGAISSTVGDYTNAFISGDGSGNIKIRTVAQDDAQTNILTWSATDKIVRWRAASTLIGGGGGGTIGGSIAPGQVAYGSGTANEIAGSADITFALGTLRLTKLTGVDIQLGDLTNTATATPAQMNMGGTYSSVAGANPKLVVYDNGAGVQFGIGAQLNTMTYLLPAATSHRFYVGTVSPLMLNAGSGIGNYMQAVNNGDVGLHIFVDPANTADAFQIKNGLVVVASINSAGSLMVQNYRGRNMPRISTATTTTNLAPEIDLYDIHQITALASTLVLANPTGTPPDGMKFMIRIKDNGTTKTLTWSGSQYRAGEMTLPIATIPGKTMYLGFIWHNLDAKWDLIAYSDNY